MLKKINKPEMICKVANMPNPSKNQQAYYGRGPAVPEVE